MLVEMIIGSNPLSLSLMVTAEECSSYRAKKLLLQKIAPEPVRRN
jgi:hypothetical protein